MTLKYMSMSIRFYNKTAWYIRFFYLVCSKNNNFIIFLFIKVVKIFKFSFLNNFKIFKIITQ